MKFYQIFQSLVLSWLWLLLIPTLGLAAESSITLMGMVQGQRQHEPAKAIIWVNKRVTSTTVTAPGRCISLNNLAGTHPLKIESPLYPTNLVGVNITAGEGVVSPTGVFLDHDLNGDGGVDIADAALVSANFGQVTASADVNADGQVNIQDLAIIGSNLGLTVPTPSAGDDSCPHHLYLPLILRN